MIGSRLRGNDNSLFYIKPSRSYAFLLYLRNNLYDNSQGRLPKDTIVKRTKLFVVTLASITAMGIATIATAAIQVPKGWYAEGNLGASRTQLGVNGAVTVSNQQGFGWGGNLGYKFMPFFAAEIGYTSYATATLVYNNANVGNVTYYSYDAAAKVICPFGDTGVAIFGKLGVAHTNSDLTVYSDAPSDVINLVPATGINNANNVFWSLGGEYTIIPTLAINGQWATAVGKHSTGKLTLYSLGLTYFVN